MKNSLFILLFFSLGILVGNYHLISFPANDLSLYALYFLLLLVGISVGSDLKSWRILIQLHTKVLLVPLATIFGTFFGVLIAVLLWKNLSIRYSLAVGAGFGYYSLSSIIITGFAGEEYGAIALLSNVIREILTLILAPVFVILFGKLSPISAGGATSMDTTLPIISQHCGNEFAVIAVIHGTILTILVPVLVTFILTF
jgi:uncharacterized membrane protein YbjE (DUF340 family)